jgi:hypothetical protein
VLGSILVFCFFGFCAGGGHWVHPHHHSHHDGERLGRAVRSEAERVGRANELVPSDWRAVPGDAHQREFMSPDGSARLRASWTATSQEPPAKHMRDVAFGTGEKLGYIEGGSDWIAVSGTKGDRRFYREAVLACEGRRWHQIEIEYPVDQVRVMAKILARSSRALVRTREAGCQEADPSPEAPTTRSTEDHVGTQSETTGSSSGSGARPPTGSQEPAVPPEHN